MEAVQEEIKSGYKLTKVGWIPEDWEVKKVINISKSLTSGSTPLRDKKEFFENGGQNWVKTTDLNNSKILETEEQVSKLALEKTSLKVLPVNTVLVAMYGGFKQIGRTGILKTPCAINQALSAIQVDDEQIDAQYLQNWLNFGVKYWRRYAASSRKDPNITKSDVKDFLIPFGQLKEQQAINSLLDSWDKAIENLTQLITEKQQKKKALMQQLLTGKKRYRGFVDEWKEVKISDIAKEYSKRNKENKDLTVLSCTKYDGLVPSLEYFGRKIYSDKLETYKVVKRDTFAYATNHINEGSIGFQNVVDEGLISPMYTCFDTNGMIDKEFFFMLLKSHKFMHEYERRTEGSIDRRGGLRWGGFSGIKFLLPSILEQQKIAKVLNAATKEIQLLNQKLDALKDQKKGLMQQLLTGKKRLNF